MLTGERVIDERVRRIGADRAANCESVAKIEFQQDQVQALDALEQPPVAVDP